MKFESGSWKMEHVRISASVHVRSRTIRFNIHLFSFTLSHSCEFFLIWTAVLSRFLRLTCIFLWLTGSNVTHTKLVWIKYMHSSSSRWCDLRWRRVKSYGGDWITDRESILQTEDYYISNLQHDWWQYTSGAITQMSDALRRTLCRIEGSHSGCYEESYPLGYIAL
jgi:hypothetical protein